MEVVRSFVFWCLVFVIILFDILINILFRDILFFVMLGFLVGGGVVLLVDKLDFVYYSVEDLRVS